MNKKIELIKIKLKMCIDEDLNYICDKEHSKILLDYITNLQEENKRLSKNQRYYKNGVFSLEYDKETMSDMIDDYKSRNEKALKYMDNNPVGSYIELRNILNGDD